MPAGNYTPAYALSAEGGRIGLVTCTQCGVCILLGADLDAMTVHDQWHRDLERDRASIPRLLGGDGGSGALAPLPPPPSKLAE